MYELIVWKKNREYATVTMDYNPSKKDRSWADNPPLFALAPAAGVASKLDLVALAADEANRSKALFPVCDVAPFVAESTGPDLVTFGVISEKAPNPTA